MKADTLHDRIYASLIGSAIGDAMGGPVEMLDHADIELHWGRIEELLRYDKVEPNPHGPHKKDAGTFTDDTRLRNLIAGAIMKKKGRITLEDLYSGFIDYYRKADTQLKKEWIEEYYYKAVFREKKLCFGGMPVNAAVMGIQPVGIINMQNPEQAFADAFGVCGFVDGYSRYSGAFVAAMTSAAFIPGITVPEVIEASLKAMDKYKSAVEGPLWRNSSLYRHVAMENEKMIDAGLRIAGEFTNPDSPGFRQAVYGGLLQKYSYDGSETVGICVAVLSASSGDFKKAVTAAVNLGRDNDSSAAVIGGICGAMSGTASIPVKWIDTVREANKDEADFKFQADSLYGLLKNNPA